MIDDLPVSHCLPEIVTALGDSRPVVLKAPPGAGKTTGVPPALFDAGVTGGGQTVLVQPRRLAARTAASRLAQLMESGLGKMVGYHVRFDRRASADTRLLVTTTGMLLRRLQSDPLLEDVSCVLLDEFHERSLDVDLVLGMLQRIRQTLRPELNLAVMSATLDPQPIAAYLGPEAVQVVSEGRSFPVDIQHLPSVSTDRLEDRIAATLPDVLNQSRGHVLVFLPGLGEIRRTQRTIHGQLPSECEVLPLYGDLPPKEQDSVLKDTGKRKVILSTNVAETSLTIPGVTAVIDSGLARVSRFDSSVGLPKLRLEPISQASADQRAGRAGRTEKGICIRLWPAASHRSRRERETPEIERADFSGAALTMAEWGERDPLDFPWLTPPPRRSIEMAKRLLTRLEAIDHDGSLTDIGRQMVRLPVHPRLARFLLAAERFGLARDATIAAACLTERDPFPRDRSIRSTYQSACDVSEKVDRIKAHFDGDRTIDLNVAAARQIRLVADQLARYLDSSAEQTQAEATDSNDRHLARALLAAYPDRVAKRREPSGDRGRMVGGRGVRLDRRSRVSQAELFLCIDVDSGDGEALVRSACAIEPEWLDARLLNTVDRYTLNSASDAVIARRIRSFDDLPLNEQPTPCQPCPEVAEILAGAAREKWPSRLPKDNDSIEAFIQRARFVNHQRSDLGLPCLTDEVIDDVLTQLCQSCTTLKQLSQAPWLDHLRGIYDYDQLRQIDENAPARIKVPSGNSIEVTYEEGSPPTMAVRIQEMFGMPETPRIAGGRVLVRLELLGPNYRAQQITEDLANFWSTTYPQVRKELRRRYPKHHWPEQPHDAVATRNGLPPRK